MGSETNAEVLDLVERARREPARHALEPDPREELVRRSRPVVERYLFVKTRTFRRVPSEYDLADIVQEAYLDAFRSIRTYDPALSSFCAWLCSIALRQSFKWLKKATRHPTASIDDLGDEDEGRRPEPSSPGHILVEQVAVLRELIGVMAGAISSIDNRDYRLVVSLLFTGWFSMGDLEELLGWNLNTLKSCFRRGMAVFLDAVTQEAGPVYARMAESIIATHKKASLAKGLSVLDVSVLDRVSCPLDRELLRRRLLEGEAETATATGMGISTADARRRLFLGLDELVRLVGHGP